MTVFENGDRVTSIFGMRTLNGVRKMHNGIDIVPINKADTKCRSTINGEVIYTSNGYNYGRGMNVIITYFNGDRQVFIRHQHANKIFVNKGQHVKANDFVIEFGATGDVTGKHDHFEVVVGGTLNNATGEIKGGIAIDPSIYLCYNNSIGTKEENNVVYSENNVEENDEMKRIGIYEEIDMSKIDYEELFEGLQDNTYIMQAPFDIYSRRWVREFNESNFNSAINELEKGEILALCK